MWATCFHLDSTIGTDDNLCTVQGVLLFKHPAGQPMFMNVLYMTSIKLLAVHPIIFEAIDATTIKIGALRTDCAAGPFGIDGCG